jgi:hypothetical protein
MNQAAIVLTWILATLAWAGAALGCYALARQFLAPGLEILGLGLLPVIGLATVAVHEGGHMIGARINQMTILTVQVGPINFLARRRGWNWRWKPSSKKLGGYVMAFPSVCLPIPRQYLWLIAGGPLTNLFVGSALAAIGFVFWPGEFGVFVLGLATINVFTGLANLLPYQRAIGSDGLMLLRWMRVKEGDASLIPLQLYARAVSGTTADLLPPEQVAGLMTMPEPMPLLNFWFVLKAHQIRLEWHEAAALAPALEPRLAALSPELTVATQDLVALIRGEIEFCRLMADLPIDGPVGRYLSSELDWLSPGLRQRFLAAELAGPDSAGEVQALLTQSEHAFAESIDRAQALGEAKIRAAVLARCRFQAHVLVADANQSDKLRPPGK